MKYSEVLDSYHPLEIGDFMYRYLINNREYIIYSPEQDKISCLELYNFKDITPYELALLIQNVQVDKKELEEFKFQYVCSRSQLLTYLFDIAKEQESDRKIRHVSNQEGYFLYEPKKSRKLKNIYQFNPETKEYQLVFDNEICYSSIYDELKSDSINVCWDPITFSLLEDKKEDQKPSYLLASANPILCAYLTKIIRERSARINLYNDKNSINALLFLEYYLNQKDAQKKFSIFSDSKMITISVTSWNPITLMKFISRTQKNYNENVKTQYGQDENITNFYLDSVDDHSFIRFPNDNNAIDVFLRNVISFLKPEDISYSEIDTVSQEKNINQSQ